ncbi:MAG: ATP-binding protein [Caldilinea sp.]
MNAAILDRIRQARAIDDGRPPAPRTDHNVCPICKDMKWIIDARSFGPPRYVTELIPCSCSNQTARTRPSFAINSQRPDEMSIRLADMGCVPHNKPALVAIQDLIAARHGFLTLTGMPGRGKSRLLHALVNEMRLLGAASEYAQLIELLDYLKEGFDRSGEFDRRWRRLIDLPALAIDELDHYNATDWATERLVTLVDQRWRDFDSKITAVAINTQLGQILQQTELPERAIRRLTDARSVVVTLYDAKASAHAMR